MVLEIIPIGGFKEIGRNCVAVRWNDEVVILDMGLQMDNYIEYTNDEREFVDISAKKLIQMDAVPDIHKIDDLRDKVKGICITHAHLDHVGAIPFLSNKFHADVHCTEFTAQLINTICHDEQINLKNDIHSHGINSRFKLSKNLKIEFVHVTHSTPQTVMIAVHTPDGTVLYANDFKLDNVPTLGPRTNLKRLEDMDVKCLIMDSLYADAAIKTPSESIAKEMLKDVLLGTYSEGNAIIITTFASHIARLKTIIEIGKTMNRKIVFLGRSLAKYADCAKYADIIDFEKDVEIVRYGNKVKKWLKNCKSPEKYMMVVTGHQGEPNSTLGKMVYGMIFRFNFEDQVIFSSKIIPTEINKENRAKLEAKLRSKNVRIFKDIHVSGHAAREDHRELLRLVKPEHIIPTHGDLPRLEALKELAMEVGYKPAKIHIIGNGHRLKISP
ncbi:MBL fold metallo-hydrolase RNA specificity domain-containing protein [Nanoarchaeota archaeon]